MASKADLLGAEALLLTTLTFLYTLWAPKVDQVLGPALDRDKAHQLVGKKAAWTDLSANLRLVRNRYCWPLVLGFGAVGLIFAPADVGVVSDSIGVLATKHLIGILNYDPAATALVVANLLSFLLAWIAYQPVVDIQRLLTGIDGLP
jgi:hypothetical protein